MYCKQCAVCFHIKEPTWYHVWDITNDGGSFQTTNKSPYVHMFSHITQHDQYGFSLGEDGGRPLIGRMGAGCNMIRRPTSTCDNLIIPSCPSSRWPDIHLIMVTVGRAKCWYIIIPSWFLFMCFLSLPEIHSHNYHISKENNAVSSHDGVKLMTSSTPNFVWIWPAMVFTEWEQRGFRLLLNQGPLISHFITVLIDSPK